VFGPAPVSAVTADERFVTNAGLSATESATLQGILREEHAISRAFTNQLRKACLSLEQLAASSQDVTARRRLVDSFTLLRGLGRNRFDTQWQEARFYAGAMPLLRKVDAEWANQLVADRIRYLAMKTSAGGSPMRKGRQRVPLPPR